MRAAAILLGLLLATAGTASAQERPEFGFKVGPTFASMDFGEEDFGYDMRTSVGGGGFLVLRPGSRVALQLEALFRPGGARITDDTEGSTAAVKFLLNYFEAPVLARVTVMRSATRSFYIFAGPAPAMRLSAKLESSATGSGFTSGTLDDISEEIKRFEVSGVAGAGMNIGTHIVVDGRYTWGLTKINKTAEDGSVKNRSLTFLVGYRF